MSLINKKIVYLTLICSVVLIAASCSSTKTVPHQGCYVADSHLRGFYSGSCRGGKAYGRGKSRGQDFYDGDFVNGVPNGQGTYVWSDGDKYVGQFKDGKAHGNGVMIYSNGTRKQGVWENNRLVYER